MKKKFNITLFAVIAFIVLSFGISKPATAQSDQGGYYDNNSNQDNNTDPDYNNGDVNNDNNGNYQDGTDQDNNNYSNGDANSQPDQDVNINTFNDALSPYGTWVNDATYGRVWVCNVAGFRPYYSAGHWVYTDYGWTWVSDYAWGWAPFHYGRWAYGTNAAWMWIPGYQWGPAWVDWRSGGAYYGWAPLAPRIGIGLGFGGYGYLSAERWAFVQRGFLGSPYLGRYFAAGYRNNEIFRSTTIINNTNIYNRRSYVAGPNRAEVERYSGSRIEAAHIANAARPGATIASANRVNMYRGSIRSNTTINRSINNRVTNNNIHQGAAIQQHYNAPQQRVNATVNNYSNYRNYSQNNISNRQPTVNRNVQTQHYNNSYQRTPTPNYSRPTTSYRPAAAPARSYSPAPRQQSTRSYSGGGGARSYATAGHSSSGGRGRR